MPTIGQLLASYSPMEDTANPLLNPPNLGPENMPQLALPASPRIAPPGQSPMTMALRNFAADLAYSLGTSLSAASKEPGNRGTIAGMGQALLAPTQRRAMEQDRADKQRFNEDENSRQNTDSQSQIQLRDAQIDAAKAKEDGTAVVTYKRADGSTYQTRVPHIGIGGIVETGEAPAKEGFTLSAGQKRFDPSGKLTAEVPANAPAPVIQPRITTKDGIMERNPETGAFDIKRGTPPPSASTINNIQLTPEGLDAAALMFAKTGNMPSLGMGNGDLRKQIINRSADLMPKIDIASNKADFDANKASLAKTTALYDALQSFENTALKNMDILEGSAKKILDSGSPLLNKPLRAIDEKTLGNVDLPVYRAARQIVVNEVAKLTSNPGLTGQLSDTARKEIGELLPSDMTLGQLLNLLPTLRQDMKNRTGSLSEQIQGIRGRISGPSGGGDTNSFIKPGGALEKLLGK